MVLLCHMKSQAPKFEVKKYVEKNIQKSSPLEPGKVLETWYIALPNIPLRSLV